MKKSVIVVILASLVLFGCKNISSQESADSEIIIEEVGQSSEELEQTEIVLEESDISTLPEDQTEASQLTTQSLSSEMYKELTRGVLDGREVELYWEDIPALHHPLYENWNLYTTSNYEQEVPASPEETVQSGEIPEYLGVIMDGEEYAGKYVGSSIGLRTDRLVHTYQMGKINFEVYADNLELCSFSQSETASDEEPIDQNEAARICKEIASDWIDWERWDARYSVHQSMGWHSYDFTYAIDGIRVGQLCIRLSQDGQLREIRDFNSHLMDQLIQTEEGEALLAEKISLFTSDDALALIQEKLTEIIVETELKQSWGNIAPKSIMPYEMGNATFWKLIVFSDGSFAMAGCVSTDNGNLMGFLLKESEPTEELPQINPVVQAYEVSEEDYQYAWEMSPYYVEGLADCPYEYYNTWDRVPDFRQTGNVNNAYYSEANYPRADNPVISYDGREYTGSFMQYMYEETISARRDVYHFQNELGEGEFELNARTGELMRFDLYNYAPDPLKTISEEEAIALARKFFNLGDRDSFYTYTCREMGQGRETKGYLVNAKLYLEGVPIAVPLYCYIATDGMIYYFYQPRIDEEIWDMMQNADALERLHGIADYYEDHELDLIRQVDPDYESYNRLGLDGAYMLPDGRWVYMQTYEMLAPNTAGGVEIGLYEPD